MNIINICRIYKKRIYTIFDNKKIEKERRNTKYILYVNLCVLKKLLVHLYILFTLRILLSF